MKYQHFSEKLMVIEREEEAKRIMMGGPAYGAGRGGTDADMYGGGAGYDNMGGGMAASANAAAQEMMAADIAAPKTRKMAAAKKNDDDEDQWGNVDALLD